MALTEKEKKRKEEERRRKLAEEGKLKKETPELKEKRQKEGQAYVKRREKLASAKGVSSKAAGRELAPTVQKETELQLRSEDVGEKVGGVKLAEELRALREEDQPDLTPDPIQEVILDTPGVGALAGALAGGTGAGVGGIAATGGVALAGAGAAAVAVGGAAAVSAGILASVAGIGIKIAGGSIFDYKGKEIKDLRQTIQLVGGASSSVLSKVKGGQDPAEGVLELRDLASSVSASEERIKVLGNRNLKFRNSNEYILVMEEIKKARNEIAERAYVVDQYYVNQDTSILNPLIREELPEAPIER